MLVPTVSRGSCGKGALELVETSRETSVSFPPLIILPLSHLIQRFEQAVQNLYAITKSIGKDGRNRGELSKEAQRLLKRNTAALEHFTRGENAKNQRWKKAADYFLTYGHFEGRFNESREDFVSGR
jgi:hypothetical protein